jgi:N-acyl-D-aspartate/D-glutamate deacylase
MAYDLLIRNGTVVDGTGAERKRADIAISEGKIAELGNVTGSAKRTVDASDLVVAPGFIDPHTHFDAQIWWDAMVTSSCWHGVTSVVMGNCGVGIAPCRPEAREIATWDLVNVEGIPFDVLKQGIEWEWESFPQYMEAARRRKFGINLAFLAPLTPFRHFVMGEESMERAATPAETAKIKTLLKEAVAAGAHGWTTTTILQHVGYKGRPLACRLANNDELKAYANALRELDKGSIEIALTKSPGILAEDEYQMLDLLLSESQRPVTWLALMERSDIPDAAQQSLRKSELLTRRGAIPQINALPLFNEISLQRPFIFASYASWKPVFNRSPQEMAEIYRSSSFREAFREDLKTPRVFGGDWSLVAVQEVHNAALKPLVNQSVAEIARARGKDPLDTFFDIALEDDLNTHFVIALFNVDEDRVARLIADSRLLMGLSDGGAHVDMHDNAGYVTYVLGTWARARQVLTLEQAVQRITSQPAAFWGIKDRGRLASGLAADICIFDFDRIGPSSEPPLKSQQWRNDLPGSGRRLIWPVDPGIKYTIVNGSVVYENGQPTGALPGTVLNS